MKPVIAIVVAAFTILLHAPSTFAQPGQLPPGEYLAVSLFDARAVALVDLSTLTVSEQIHTRFKPDQLVAVNATSSLYIFPSFSPVHGRPGDDFIHYGLAEDAVRARIETAGPFTGQPNETGTKLYVSNLDQGGVDIVNTSTNTITGSLTATPRPDYMDLDSANHELYVGDNAHNRITVYDTTTDQQVRQFDAGSVQQFVVANGRVYWTSGAAYVYINDAATFAPVTTLSLVHFPFRLRPSPDRSRVWVITHDENASMGEVVGIDTATDMFVSSTPYTGSANDVVVSSAGDTAYIPFSSADAIGALDLSSAVMTMHPVGRSPFSVTFVTVPAP